MSLVFNNLCILLFIQIVNHTSKEDQKHSYINFGLLWWGMISASPNELLPVNPQATGLADASNQHFPSPGRQIAIPRFRGEFTVNL